MGRQQARFTEMVFAWRAYWLARRGRSLGNRRPLYIELLEGRCVPTTITPTTYLDGGLGSGSLRDAVLQFNADSGTDDDIIQLEAGTYALTIQNVGGRHETAGLTGDLNLTQTSHRWIIQGTGPSTIIDASQLQDRVFQIVNPGTQVVFQDLVIQGGLSQDDGSDGSLAGTTDALGGGIFNNGGDVTLDHVVVQSNVARGGVGGSYQAAPGYNARGGGLYSTGGALTISHSTLATNQATGGHGGGPTCSSPIMCYGGFGGPGGDSQGGGMYLSGGMLTLTDSTLSANTLKGGDGGTGPGCYRECNNIGGDGGASQGGGLYGSGTLAVSNSTIAANTASGGTGGPGTRAASGGEGEGGGLYVSGTLTVSNSTIAANTVRGGDGGSGYYGVTGAPGLGGGLYVSGTLTVSNSTITANTVRGGDGGSGLYDGGSGGVGYGGGLFVAHVAAAQVSFSTIATNQATGGTHASGFYFDSDGPALGGGLQNEGLLQTRDTLLAGNIVNGPGTHDGPDLDGDLGSLGHNLVGNSEGGQGFDTTDLLDVDPLLGPLQDNGGPTQTMALLPGSPAIDAGDNTGAPDSDQRGPGYPRIVNGIIDIGAFEVQSDRPGTNLDGLTHAYLLTPEQPSTGSGRFHADAQLAQTSGLAKAAVDTVISAVTGQPRQPVPIESLRDQPVEREATDTATTMVIGSRAEDAAFAAWYEPLLDSWAVNGPT
jgi:hypothetical protein